MFSGKSEELIRRLRRARIARQKVQVFKPEIDNRFAQDHIVSHSEMRHESTAVKSAAELRSRVANGTEVVGIDEGQFFDSELVDVVNELAHNGMRVIVAGLDQDYTGKPFGSMPQLLAIAEYITKPTPSACVAVRRLITRSALLNQTNLLRLVQRVCTKPVAGDVLCRMLIVRRRIHRKQRLRYRNSGVCRKSHVAVKYL